MIKIGIVGAAGYSGAELIKLLAGHKEVEITGLYGNSTVGRKIEEIHPSLKGIVSHEIEEFKAGLLNGMDLLFVALPSGESMQIVEEAFLAGVKVIDLGGDFRLKNINDYKEYYGHTHSAAHLLEKAVYGLSEWNSPALEKANLVANPGCYPTGIQLALIPLLREKLLEDQLISIVSYSGTSGAGKSANANMIFSEVNESVRAYKVGKHQHIPEIKEYLGYFGGVVPKFTFVPHLLPVTRGIYTTITASVKSNVSEKDVIDLFEDSYGELSFIRLLMPAIPELKNVLHTNFCDISFKITGDGTITIFSAIDNLVKGAAGQAVQNMNIMFGLDPTEGLLKCSKKKAIQVK